MKLEAGMVTEVCHVTYDLESATARANRIFGAGPFFVFDIQITDRIYRGQPGEDEFKPALGFSGTTLVEYIQPTNDAPSIFREVLDAKGDLAVHHFCPNMRPMKGPAFDAQCAVYAAKGLKPALTFRVTGAGRVVFYDAREEIGAFIEILEAGEEILHLIDAMYAAHLEGAQGRPLRPMSELFAA